MTARRSASSGVDILNKDCERRTTLKATGYADGTGTIDPELLVAVVSKAGAPVICETADEGRKDDIAFLKANA